MEKLDSALCLWTALYTNYFNVQFLIFIHFTNQVTLKPSLAQKLKLIFKFSTITEQINVPIWTHMRHKGWRKDRKTFTRCYPSWHSDVVTTLSEHRFWRCHNVVAPSKMRVVPTSVSDVVTTSLSDLIKTLPKRCCNIATTLSIGFLGHFNTNYSDFFPFIETWESYKSVKWH